MGLLLLQIWLLGCLFYYASTSMVSRGKIYDKISPNTCVKSCQQHNAYCADKKSTCCKECKCNSVEKTFYRTNLTQSCVKDPNKEEGCKYSLRHVSWIQLKRVNEMKLGELKHQEVKLFSYKCMITNKQYWNLLEWKDFNDDEKSFEIYRDTDYFIKLNIPGKNTSLYDGYLVKLKIDCSNGEKEESCIILKIIGQRKYDANTEAEVIKPTKQTSTVKPTRKTKKKKKSILIIVVIAVSAAILLVIVAVSLWWCWKKKRKGSGQKNGEREYLNNGEDPNYQHSDRFSVRHSTELNNSANNLTYLQPVDAGLPNSSSRHSKDKKKKKKDPNYDYPDINNLSKKSNHHLAHDHISKEKPIYAEVTEMRKPDPEYTDPDMFIKPRSQTEVVGVPGYQPPRGPYSDDTKSTYSSLSVVSPDDSSTYQSLLDSERTVAPPSPQYAIVEHDENTITI